VDLIMGKILRLNGVSLTDSTAPKILERDLIESEGSLFLYDGAHSFGSFAGVWPSNAPVPNVLSNKASLLLGVDQSLLNFVASPYAPVAGKFFVERTPKGGFHGIITQGGSQVAQHASALYAPSAIRLHVKNNPTRSFYASLWSTVTRTGIAGAAGQSSFHMAQNTTNLAFHFQTGVGSAPFNGSAQSLGIFNAPSTPANDFSASATPFNRFASLGWDEQTGTGPGDTNIEFGVGTFGAWSSLNYNKGPSRIIYRAYLEDLTASGRTFAQVRDIDYALYQAAFAPGGKFHGDTYTNPSTLP
jgi:hypothetical protein